jgi:hypothetical protein
MEMTYHGEEGQLFYLTTRSSFNPNDAGTFFTFTKGLFDETLIVSPRSDDPTLLQLEVESPYEDYLDSISTLLTLCGYLSDEPGQEGQQTLPLVEDITTEMRLCLSTNLFDDLDRILLLRQELLSMRDNMTPLLRNYTCDDDSLETTAAVEVREEVIHDGVFEVQTLFQKEAAQIFLIPNFVTEKECQQLVETSRPNLQRAAVVGPNGMAEYSESRRAQQAGYDIARGVDDPLW